MNLLDCRLMHGCTARIIHDDCLSALLELRTASIDLVYLDPPFNTGRTMRAGSGAYADSWDSIDAYLEFMQPRIEQLHRVLRRTGAIYLHCDWRTCHHLRLLLDDVFGSDNFVNHLIWKYGLGGSSPRRFARKHDDILFYARTQAYFFEPPMVPATSNRMKGQMKKATDVLDVPAINNMALERVGYPTQKPIALLKILIEAACPSGGLVLDPFCGSGTTVVAALATGRTTLGIDCNPDAIRLAQQRIDAQIKQKSAQLRDAS